MIRRASERKTGKEVAIKTVSRDQIDKAGIRREIIVLQRLNSDQLVKILKSYHTGKLQNSNHTSKNELKILRVDFFQRLIYKMCIFESKTVQSIIVVSEWLAGGSLFQKLIDSETYSEATVMFYFNQVAEFRFNASPSIELNISGLVTS